MKSMTTLAASLAAVVLLTGCMSWIPEPIVDRPAPELKIDRLMQAPDRDSVDWIALHGKVVVLQFWAPWDDQSTLRLGHLNHLADTFAGQPVQFLWVTTASPQEVERFTGMMPIHGWIGLNPDGQTQRNFKVGDFPHTVVVNQKGIVQYATKPHLVTENLIRDLLLNGKRTPLP
jgi:hypothetical protein